MMDNALFLQHLRDLSLEDGRAYIQEHFAELTDLDTIGNLLADEALAQLYTPFLSLKLAELLIFFGELTHHASSHALGLKAKGDVLVQISHYQAAIECLDGAGEEFLHLGDEGNWARSRISWIVAAAWLGHVEKALEEANRARNVFYRIGEHYWICIIDSNTAAIYAQVGRYQDAVRLYKEMLAIYPTLTDQSETFIRRAIAIAEANQALNLARLGKFEQAYSLQQRAQASFIALKETSLIINAEIHLADLDYTQGYYGSALRRYYQVQDTLIQNNIDNPRLLAEIKLQMANALVKLNRAHDACELAQQAVEIYRQPSVSLPESNALREYAATLVASGRLQEAIVALNEAWVLFNQGGFNHHASATRLQRAELLLEMGSIAEAYNEARAVKGYFEAQGLVVTRSVRASLVMVGSLIEQAQQAEIRGEKEQQAILLQEAGALCKQSALQARQHHLQEEVYKSQYFLARVSTLQGDSAKAARHYGAAIAQIERILDDLVFDLSPSFLHTAWRAYEDMIALCLQQKQIELAFSYLERARSMALRQYLNSSKTSLDEKGKQGESFPSPELQASSALILRTQHELKSWQDRYRRYSVLLTQVDTSVSPTVEREIIEAELKRCEVKISELFERLYLHQTTWHTPDIKKGEKRKPDYPDIVQLRQHLSSDQLLLAYFLYKDRLVIFAVTAKRITTYEIPDGMRQLKRLLPLFYAHLQLSGWPDPQQPPQQGIRQMLNKLYQLLIAPAAAVLPPSGSLTIIPYSSLHQLPFHALYNGSHFLIEDFQINYLPASNLLAHLDTGESEETNNMKGGLPDPGSIKNASTEPLKLPLVFGYSGHGHLQCALEEAKTLAEMLGGRCYLEDEATTARLIEEAPGSPIIHLATHGHSRLDAPNFSSILLADGRFNAIDAFSLNLKRCELLTLSGCETGLALTGGGDEQLGLGRAFLAVGAVSLVMSLWSVEDNVTQELMQLFYQNLLRGDSKVQALRAAQCSLIHRSGSMYTHPYFWAAFRLVGEVGPLKYQLRAKDHSFALKTESQKT